MQVWRRGAWDLFLAARGTNRFLIGGGPDFIQIHLGPSFCFPPPPPPPLPPVQVSPARHSFHMPSSFSWFPHRYSRRSQRRKEGKGGKGEEGEKRILGEEEGESCSFGHRQFLRSSPSLCAADWREGGFGGIGEGRDLTKVLKSI